MLAWRRLVLRAQIEHRTAAVAVRRVPGSSFGPVLMARVMLGRFVIFLPVVPAWGGLVLWAQVEHRTAVVPVTMLVHPGAGR